jgi:hypothetical protein
MKKLGLIFLALCLAATSAPSAEPARPAVSLTNFEPNLPVIFLQTTQQIRSELKVPCSVRMVLPQGAEAGNTGALTGLIRFHGATSQGYPKKSFGLTLDTPTPWLGMRDSAHWVLNAAFVDRSLMRHKLSYDLFRSLSGEGAKRFASASRFVEVNLNGRYHGAYLLMERVDRALLELRRYDSNAPSQAVIYKAVDHSANFSQPGNSGYEQREPDAELGAYWGALEEFNRFASRTKDAEFFHPETGIASRLDLDNVIDFHLLVLLTSNMDGNDKNFIFARNAPTSAAPRPRFFFAPWDYDATFGRNWEASRVGTTAWLSNHLFDRLLGNKDYSRKFAVRWQQLRTNEFSVENITRLIDDNARTLGEAAKRNETRWRTLDGPYPDRLNFEQDLKQTKEWVAARTRWLDGEIGRRGGAPAAAR